MDFNDAKAKAVALCADVNKCEETEHAFVFYVSGGLTIGGNGPVVILKKNGRAINMVAYTEMEEATAPVIKEYEF